MEEKGFLNPLHNVEQFGIMEGMHVADFGAGSGFYTIACAKKVGDAGKVYAVDIQKELLLKIKDEARKQNLDNVEIIWGDLDKEGGSKLSSASIDAVIISNVLFQAEDKASFAKEADRVLKPKGRILLVDWLNSFGNLGPTSEMIFSKEEARKIFEENGFSFDREIDAGAHHYGMVFKKS